MPEITGPTEAAVRLIYRPDAIHAQLLDEAERKKLPECFERDLTVHDLEKLHSTQTQDFIWILRTCGTYLWPLEAEHVRDSPGNRPTDLVRCMADMDSHRFYYRFHEGRLREVTFDIALAMAADALERHRKVMRLHREWNAANR